MNVVDSRISNLLHCSPPDASRSTAAAAAVGQPLTKKVVDERYAELFTV